MKEMEAIGSEQAKAEHEARRQMMKEDEAKILHKEGKKHRINFDGVPNFAPYNWILSTVSFKKVKNTAEGMRLLYNYIWGYIRRYEIELNTLKNYIGSSDDKRVQEIIDSKTPLAMCEHSLNEVTKAARMRAKAKKYGVEVTKRGLIKGDNSSL